MAYNIESSLAALRNPRNPMGEFLKGLEEKSTKKELMDLEKTKLAVALINGKKGKELSPDQRAMDALMRVKQGIATPEDKAAAEAWVTLGGVGTTAKGQIYPKRTLDFNSLPAYAAANSEREPSAQADDFKQKIADYEDVKTRANAAGIDAPNAGLIDKLGTAFGDFLYGLGGEGGGSTYLKPFSPLGAEYRDIEKQLEAAGTFAKAKELGLGAKQMDTGSEAKRAAAMTYSSDASPQAKETFLRNLREKYPKDEVPQWIKDMEERSKPKKRIKMDANGNIIK